MSARIVLSGYLVRQPLGGYAWQAAHYLLGLRALGHDVWFYEDTSLFEPAYNPLTGEYGNAYAYGVSMAAGFLGQLGLGDRWAFVTAEAAYGPAAGRAATLLREADLVISLGGVNRLALEQRAGRPAAYVDIDPAYTQLRVAGGQLRDLLDAHTHLFTFGENIGTPRSPIPTGGYIWHPTRPAVLLDRWDTTAPPGPAYTTIGTWDAGGRDLEFAGEVFRWRKRTEWFGFLDLPGRSGARFQVAMDVASVRGDPERLVAHGWEIVDPLAVSVDPWAYRRFIQGSRGEFTVAKDVNVRLRSGWFSDRTACYLAAGRPAIEQDTGFGDVLPLGRGLHAYRTLDEAVAAVELVEADLAGARAHARALAHEYLAAEKVLGRMLATCGL